MPHYGLPSAFATSQYNFARWGQAGVGLGPRVWVASRSAACIFIFVSCVFCVGALCALCVYSTLCHCVTTVALGPRLRVACLVFLCRFSVFCVSSLLLLILIEATEWEMGSSLVSRFEASPSRRPLSTHRLNFNCLTPLGPILRSQRYSALFCAATARVRAL